MNKLRWLVIASLLVFSTPVMAQETKINWSLNLFPLDGVTYEGLNVDVGITPRYARLNGALVATGGGANLPVVGSCVLSDPFLVVCDLRVRRYLMILEVNSTLGGNFRLLDQDGVQFNSGVLFYTGIVSN